MTDQIVEALNEQLVELESKIAAMARVVVSIKKLVADHAAPTDASSSLLNQRRTRVIEVIRSGRLAAKSDDEIKAELAAIGLAWDDQD